ncbi:GNAT family N-acetyltransferase [Oceanibium sediminis]|uniref:GNAT family N-acetyltransferase n=1 Tax=Oceanibium sediminis TaxID=2026339 RepID=UPI000DD4BD6C|nr:GNAT family N-acetyltransferase [Oceanibium sediminis]
MPITGMTRDDLAMVLGWAAEEGWNPGLDDADAFFAADPGGFFLNIVDGEPAAAISVVNHSADFAFLGLYICRPAFRGQGHGLALWQDAIRHAGTRCVGLDGVPDQQDNYRRSGFSGTGRTIRYRGQPQAASATALRPAEAADMALLLDLDRAASGLTREAYARAWFAGTPTRRTLILNDRAAATYRRCGEGVKIGPLFAPDAEAALTLLRATPFPGQDRPVFVDIPETCTALSGLATGEGFGPVFETARMYTGTPPESTPPPFHAVMTLELG